MNIIFDIGATHSRFTSTENGKLGEIIKLHTPEDLESAKVFILENIKKIAKGKKINSIVGGIAGMLDNGRIINSPNLKGWNNFDLRSFLQDNLCKNSSIYNDADMAGLGENIYGAGQNSNIMTYLTISTGVGGTRIVNNKIDNNIIGFEPGHHIISLENNKTFEQIVSGNSIYNDYGKYPEDMDESFFKKLTPKLAVGIYNSIIFWSPDVLVLGGALMVNNTGFKIKDLEKELEKLKGELVKLPKIKKAQLGDESGLWGAVVITEEFYK